MSRYIRWYLLSLKSLSRRPYFIICMVIMTLMMFILSTVTIPDAGNAPAIVYGSGGDKSELAARLSVRKGGIRFIKAENEEQVAEAVESGKADCGFIFSDKEDLFEKGSIRYIYSRFTKRGETAKETVFAEYFQMAENTGSWRLASNKEIFGGDTDTKEIYKKLMEKNKEYIAGTKLFRIEYADTGNMDAVAGEAGQSSGVTGAVIFIVMLILTKNCLSSEREDFYKKLSRKRKNIYRLIEIFSPGIYMAVLTTAVYIFSGDATDASSYFGSLMVYILICTVWLWIYTFLFRDVRYYDGFMAVTIVSSLILCPVFIDISVYIPAIKVIRYFLPVTYSCIRI